MFRILLFMSLTILLSSCASYFVRKSCEKQNWYQVGFDAAMRGDRIANDPLVNQCRTAEAEMSEQQLDTGWKAGTSRYCQPDAVFHAGKSGELFNTDFCEASQLDRLRKKHADGILAYCQNGKAAGLSGKKYKNVCPANAEKTFLPDYRLGRKKYLETMVGNVEIKRRDLSVELDKLDYEKRIADGRLSVLPAPRVGDKDPYEEERRRLDSRSRTLSNEISQKNALKTQYEKELDEYRKEMATLN